MLNTRLAHIGGDSDHAENGAAVHVSPVSRPKCSGQADGDGEKDKDDQRLDNVYSDVISNGFHWLIYVFSHVNSIPVFISHNPRIF